MKVGLKNKVIPHIMKVNKWTKKEALAYIGYAFQEHKIRSKQKWEINLSVLNEKYGVKKQLINESMRKKPKTKSKKLNYVKNKKRNKKSKRKKPKRK